MKQHAINRDAPNAPITLLLNIKIRFMKSTALEVRMSVHHEMIMFVETMINSTKVIFIRLLKTD